MYRQEGAVVVDSGAKMNPSTYELIAAIHSAGTDEVVVLPNSPNVVMAAERAAELSECNARVVATRSPQEGLAAIVAFNSGASAEENAEALWGAVSALATGGVAPAARDDALGKEEAGRKLAVPSRRAHDDRERRAVEAHVERFLCGGDVFDAPRRRAVDARHVNTPRGVERHT